jgi:hypothetical protein
VVEPTFAYFERNNRFDGAVPIRAPDRAANRLCTLPYRLPRTDWHALANAVQSTSPNASFFLDASFLGRTDLPDDLWDALLTRRIVFTRLVWSELQPWFNDPFANKYFHSHVAKARQTPNDSIVFFSPKQAWSENVVASASYYVHLLACRKSVGLLLKHNFEKKHGRLPSPDELSRLVQKVVQDRGWLLARKGLEHGCETVEEMFSDEEVVVCALFNALTTGHETHIWATDPDLIELFYKAQYLIDTHYRTMLIADRYKADPSATYVQRIPVPHGSRIAEFFKPPEILSVFFNVDHLPRVVLPTEFSPVLTVCERFVQHRTHWSSAGFFFTGEREMLRLMEFKGKSDGLNSLALEGQNCHIVLTPPFPKGTGGRVWIGTDQAAPFVGQFPLPLVDINYAILPIERFAAAAVADDTSA